MTEISPDLLDRGVAHAFRVAAALNAAVDAGAKFLLMQPSGLLSQDPETGRVGVLISPVTDCANSRAQQDRRVKEEL